MSLLQQHSAATKGAPASTQFTFTCDSQVPGNNIQWPGKCIWVGEDVNLLTQSPGHASKHNMPAQAGPGYLPHSSVVHHDGSSIAASRGSGSSRQDSKRRLERSLERAARRRRQAATEARRANPESTEHGWICEFCEYESIFGEPPRALIRTYEIKDRKRRQEEADRKRLLEKAKAKSRKGRKGGKASSRDHAAAQPPPQDQGDHMDGNHHHPAQSEGDEEEYPNLSGERTGPDIRSEGPPS